MDHSTRLDMAEEKITTNDDSPGRGLGEGGDVIYGRDTVSPQITNRVRFSGTVNTLQYDVVISFECLKNLKQPETGFSSIFSFPDLFLKVTP